MDKNDAVDILCKVLKDNHIEPSDDMLNKFETYYGFLVYYNKKVNLTAITDYSAVYVKHFADSAAFSSAFKTGASVCDIGTGAGFPGVVLKIIRPDLKLTLVDSLNKRVVFLDELTKKLNLKDVKCLHYRAEDLDFKEKYLNSFDYVVARAVAGLPTLTEYCLPYVKIGGQFIAYKSNDVEVEIAESNKCIMQLGGIINRFEKYHIDDNIIRTAIIIDKCKNTDKKYPRGQNKPRTNPLK